MVGAVLVMCDVRNPDSTPHATNTRAKLVELLTPDVVAEKPMYGFEQVRSSTSTHAQHGRSKTDGSWVEVLWHLPCPCYPLPGPGDSPEPAFLGPQG